MDSPPPDPQPVGTTEGGAVRDLSVIQKCYDLILWLQPRIQKLPRDDRFTLGTRIETGLHESRPLDLPPLNWGRRMRLARRR